MSIKYECPKCHGKGIILQLNVNKDNKTNNKNIKYTSICNKCSGKGYINK